MDKLVERFYSYVKIDTQSNDESLSTPSEAKELDLTRKLLEDLKELGINGEIDEFGRLYAKVEGEKDLEPIGLNAHVDTALELSGKDVKPQLIENYDGGTIKLNEEYSMGPEQFPDLKRHIGEDLIVTSGDTLLGADDKAGLTIIMEALRYYKENPEKKHRTICILFTPDEEIGRGPEHFDAKKFGAEWAYTIDGAFPHIIETENFNASHAEITVKGFVVHPGEAKGKMVNAIHLAKEFDSLLNPAMRPEHTSGHDGFYHLNSILGTSNETKLGYIIRNHDLKKLHEQEDAMYKAAAYLNLKYPKGRVEVKIRQDYRNMKEVFDKDPRAVKHAKKVYKELGIDAVFEPIRGGTDGATFSFLGCPTPNLGTGSYNHHGRYEYASVQEMKKMVEIVIGLTKAE